MTQAGPVGKYSGRREGCGGVIKQCVLLPELLCCPVKMTNIFTSPAISEACPAMEVTLDAVGRTESQLRVPTKAKGKEASFIFENVMPGSYKGETFLSLSFSLSVSQSVCLSVCLFLSLSLFLSRSLSICLSVCPFSLMLSFCIGHLFKGPWWFYLFLHHFSSLTDNYPTVKTST